MNDPLDLSQEGAEAIEPEAGPLSDGEDPLAGVPEDIRDLLPGYLQNRRRDLALCREHLQAGRFEPIRVAAHGMAGSGGAYGFDEITRIGRALHAAVRAASADGCARALDELEAFLRRVDAASERASSPPGGPASGGGAP